MHVRVIEAGGGRYLEVLPGTLAFESEDQALEVVAACGEWDTCAALLHGDALTRRFLDLTTGLAGAILQKFVNYHVRVAVLWTAPIPEGRFGEYVREANRGSHVRVFADRAAAEAWLVGP
ncbi:MAG: DUF4180 domain-containing protein [Deltaproteobacteria bacterium]|nr:DUF4180 domain-containing protein [Deltaproteobacteria bacterium]